MPRTLALLAITLPLGAQFAEVASTDDGEQVYFTTQALRQGTARPNRPFSEWRAYRVISSGLELFAERGDLARPDGSGSGDGVIQLSVSGDGQSVSYTLNQICVPNEPCNRTLTRAEIRGRYARVLGDGTAWLSRNGEWALFTPSTVPASRPGDQPQLPAESTLTNLRTGETSRVPVPIARGNPLASDGSVLVSGPSPSGQGVVPGIRKGSEFRPISLPPGVWIPQRISDDGRRVFLLLTQRAMTRLHVFDLTTGTSTMVSVEAEAELTELLGVSNNGDRALVKFVDPEQANRAGQPVGRAAIVDTETGRQIVLPLPANELATTGTLSGYGNAAFLFTTSGRLLRFDFDAQGANNRTRELLPPSPYVCCGDVRVTPGDLARLNITAPGVPDWTGRLRLGDTPLPVLSTDASSVTVQIPWELPTGLSELSLELPGDTPFVPAQHALITVALPRFVPAEPGSESFLPGLKMVKADFSDYVNARPGPGEIVHVYMTGLGPVRGSVATGQPAPLNDIRPITGTIGCRFLPHTTEAETLFAGLAPGTLGYYQVTLRMPSDPGSGSFSGVICQFRSDGFASTMSLILAPVPLQPQ